MFLKNSVFLNNETPGNKFDFDSVYDAAHSGDAKSMYELALYHRNYKGNAEHCRKYYFWLEKAIAANLPEAMYEYAIEYRHENSDLMTDAKYFHLLKKAAKSKLPSAMMKLASEYYWGQIVDADMNKYLKWLTKNFSHSIFDTQLKSQHFIHNIVVTMLVRKF